MNREDAVAANRAAWNESAQYHQASDDFAELLEGFSTPGFSALDAIATSCLERIGVNGKRVAQACCNKGSDILSIENMGAGTCVGFDISGKFLDLARQLATAGNLRCQFVETDVYKIPAQYDGQFDLCVITIGVFGWMPDVNQFLKVVARLLAPGGKLFVYEEHPIMNMFEPFAINRMLPANSYFRQEPFEESGPIVYDASNPGPGGKHYWYVHPLSDILNGCIRNGIAIDSYHEYSHNISSDEFAVYEEQEVQLPMSYTLTGTCLR